MQVTTDSPSPLSAADIVQAAASGNSERLGPLQVAAELTPEPEQREIKLRIVWAAMSGMQQELMACPATFILLGGARGPGKSEGMLIGDVIRHMAVMGGRARVLILRRRLKHAEDTIEDIRWAWESIGGRVPSSSGDASKIIRFPDGSTIRFGYLEDVGDASQYSGKNFSYIGVEEINQIGSQEAVLRLLATLRAEGPERKMVGTCNWEGPGTGWLKEMFVRPHPAGRAVIHRELPSLKDGKRRRIALCYIPSKVTDNRVITRTRPDYINNLLLSTEHNPELRRSWLDGDPDALSGTFFTGYFDWIRRGGIVHPFHVPEHWPRFICGDWGTAKPFAFYWLAEATEPVRTHREGVVIPAGSLIAYREYYGIQTDEFGRITPNVGVRMPAYDVGREIWRLGHRDPGRFTAVLDPAQFRQTDGPTVAQELWRGELEAAQESAKFPPSGWVQADNTRVGEQGHMGGWDQFRMRLRGAPCREAGSQRRPLFYAFDTCIHLRRVLPSMVHSDKNPEDMAKGPGVEDHPPDAVRYGFMARPMRRREEQRAVAPEGTWTWGGALRRAGFESHAA